MRKLIYTILLLFIATPLFGQSTVIVAKKKAAATCSVDTNEVGTRSELATDRTLSSGYLYLWAATADCTGDLAVPYLYHNATDTPTVRLCIYSKSDTTPQEADALICDSGDIVTGGSTGWKTGTTCASGSVTSTTEYWIGVQLRAGDNWVGKRGSSATLYYVNGSASTCAATLTGKTFSTSASNAPLSAYFQIGD
jgi:hypothetical protein